MDQPPKKFNPRATTDLLSLFTGYKKISHLKKPEESFVEKLTPILAQNPDPNIVDKTGCSALQVAIMYGYTNAIRLLLKAGANLNQKTGSGLTLVHLLLINIPALLPQAQPKRLALLELLLSSGADLNLKGKVAENFECSALITAMKGPDMEALKIMLSHFNNNATTPLHIAIRSNADLEVITYILTKFPETINAQDIAELTPLHLAAFTNSPHITLLLQAGASVNTQDQADQTPLHWAMSSGRSHEAIQILIEHGADPSLCDMSKNNAAQTAKDQGTRNVLLVAVQQRVDKLKFLQDFPEPLLLLQFLQALAQTS
jgi:ankyrin repeat protein